MRGLEKVRGRRIGISNRSCNHKWKSCCPAFQIRSLNELPWAPLITVAICCGKRDWAGLLRAADARTIWVYFYPSPLLLQSPAALKWGERERGSRFQRVIVPLWGSNPAAISERKAHSLSAVPMEHDFMDNIFSPAVDKDCIADFVCIHSRLIWSPGDCHDASLSWWGSRWRSDSCGGFMYRCCLSSCVEILTLWLCYCDFQRESCSFFPFILYVSKPLSYRDISL